MHEQLILFGSPGTGKSYEVKERLSGVGQDKIFRVTIHPEFSYTDFVGQLLPTNQSNGSIIFEFKEGPFTLALKEAFSDYNKEVFLVLEELSRGNVSAIFGDIFQLLDRNKHFKSIYPIWNKNIADRIPTLTTDEVYLPSNFNIICTVNMNDQNVFPMDTAFKRRFDWEYISSTPVIDKTTNAVNSKLNNPKIKIARDGNRSNDLEVTWQAFYTTLNEFITNKEKGLGKKEDKQIGQFFISFPDSLCAASHSVNPTTANSANKTINTKIRNKLLLYLWQDVQGVSLFGGAANLFDKTINSYDELYANWGDKKIFSDAFINDFLSPNLTLYPY